MEQIRKIGRTACLAILMSFFAGNAYAQESTRPVERPAKSKQVKKLTKEQMESIRKRLNNFNAEIKKELFRQKDRKGIQNYDSIVETSQLYAPKDIKLLYTQAFDFKEEGKNIQWHVGGELSKTRDLKNIQLGGEIGNFGIKAFIDTINNNRTINFKAGKDKNLVEVVMRNERLSKGRLKTSIPKIAEVNLLYDFNNERFNYSVSKNYEGINLNFAQQFRKDLVISSVNLNYALSKIGLPGKVKINYVFNEHKNQENSDRLGIVLQEKIGILNLEGKIDKTSAGVIPSITAKINYSWK